MIPDPGVLLLLLLLGGWVALDGTSLGQVMVSRPVVAATLAGWIAGDPAGGALLGLILEALNLTVLPVGAARYPEIGPAAVVAAGALAGGLYDPALLLLGAAFALSWAWVGGRSVRLLRQWNVRVLAPEVVVEGDPRLLERRHLESMAADFARGAALVAVGLLLLGGLRALTEAVWGLTQPVAQAVVWAAAAAGAAATLRLFGERRTALFVLGLLCGCLFLVLR